MMIDPRPGVNFDDSQNEENKDVSHEYENDEKARWSKGYWFGVHNIF